MNETNYENKKRIVNDFVSSSLFHHDAKTTLHKENRGNIYAPKRNTKKSVIWIILM